jgi:hypothetical protein
LGQSEFTRRDQGGNVESIPAEVFCDLDRPVRRCSFAGP